MIEEKMNRPILNFLGSNKNEQTYSEFVRMEEKTNRAILKFSG